MESVLVVSIGLVVGKAKHQGVNALRLPTAGANSGAEEEKVFLREWVMGLLPKAVRSSNIM